MHVADSWRLDVYVSYMYRYTCVHYIAALTELYCIYSYASFTVNAVSCIMKHVWTLFLELSFQFELEECHLASKVPFGPSFHKVKS